MSNVETETRAVNEEGDEHHVVLHVKHERGNCHCGRGPKRTGGAGNCLECHREIQQRYRDRQREEIKTLRQFAADNGRTTP